MQHVYNDGGRAAAGFKGDVGDCVTRAIAIAAELPYLEVYHALHQTTLNNRAVMARNELNYGRHARRHASPRDGVNKKVSHSYLIERGWLWTPTMRIGSGCQVHLRAAELPSGRLIVKVSKHMAAVIDGVIHDTHDPSRDGTRCVYGYYTHA